MSSKSSYGAWVYPAVSGSAAVRAALRGAGNSATEPAAYKYVARFWSGAPYLKPPICLHASAVATFDRIPDGDTPFGHVVGQLTRQGLFSADTVDGLLAAAETMPLARAHHVFTTFLRAANSRRVAVDWEALFTSYYRLWDHPDVNVRRRVRRRLAETYYALPSEKGTT